MDFAQRYGPWAVIAGASEGTGAAFAHELAGHGLNCILIARRAAPLEALAADIRAQTGVECITATIDLATPDATDRIIEVVGGREIGLFISNVGSDTNGSQFLDVGETPWVEMIYRNVMMPTRCCHHFGGKMRERGRGGLIIVGSGACYMGASLRAVYSATKAFDVIFGEGLWAELQPHGVDVLGLILSRTDTPAFRKLMAEMNIPVPDGLASPADVARIGIERLPHGPVHNWGSTEDEPGFGPGAPAERRKMIIAMSHGILGPKDADA